MYRRSDTGEPITISRAGSDLRVEGGPQLTARSATRFVAATGGFPTYDFSADGLNVTDSFGSVDLYARVRGDELVVRPVAEYAGTYVSDEAEVTLVAAVDGNTLVLKRRPDDVIRLSPLYRDAFRGPIGFVRFHRDSANRIINLSVTQDRVWDLRFRKDVTVGSR
jgi:hypothetical protein